MGASITVDSASSWDNYVKKHLAAKPYRNQGWVHFCKVTLIMPATVSGSNIFHPTSTPIPNDTNNNSVSPEPESPPVTLSDPHDVNDSDHDKVSNYPFNIFCSLICIDPTPAKLWLSETSS